MARTLINPAVLGTAGSLISFVASDVVNGNAFANVGSQCLVVRNTGAIAANMTLRTVKIEDGDLKLPDRVVSVPPTPIGTPAFMYRPVQPDIYNQTDGTVSVDGSPGLTLAVVSI
jgi:hypothetical protein